MKRTLIAATIAALTIPVGFAAPAMADGRPVPPPVLGPVGTTNLNLGGFEDAEPSVDFGLTTSINGDCLPANVGLIECTPQSSSTTTFLIPTGTDTVTHTADLTFDVGTDLKAPHVDITGDFISLNVRSSARAKTPDVLTARSHKRISRMAQHLNAAPGDVINIHAYGPDKDAALAKGYLVREQLRADIIRLGGNPSAHHAAVTYAGNPDHKKGVDVTIHQHAGSKHTKAHAWVNTHLASKNSTLTDEHRQAVAAHLVASSTPEQVQAAWDIDMNEDVSLVDPAQVTEIARYFLDHPDQHILVRDHVGTGVHGSTVVDAVLAEMARLAAEDGVVMTRGFLDWLGQVVVAVQDFTDDLNAAEVEIHAVTVALDDAATAIATTITDVTTLVGDVITDVETVINPIVTAVDEGTVVVKTVKDVVTAIAL